MNGGGWAHDKLTEQFVLRVLSFLSVELQIQHVFTPDPSGPTKRVV